MSLAIDALVKISPWKEAWSIEAKILTIWEDAMIVNENMQKLLHMVLMDKQHHKIQATVEDDLIPTFIDQLKEGDVFIISDFKVIPNRGLVRVTRHRTSVVAAASIVIPNPGLSLTSRDQILQKCIDYEYLIDFVGVLYGLKKRRDVECNGKILKVLTLEVFAYGKKISCNFCWLLSCSYRHEYFEKVLETTCCNSAIFQDQNKVSLQNVINISRVLINPNMQETVNFLNQLVFFNSP
ncbi:hypothetical protein Ahy_Scaffold2g107620 [Arachis hypogaea]|uniref:Replication protein A 70 kDa DNA-binding subunit B/D first OB fold domain-containing protein n=1 Tax=Arachis hypogaea TaxID=3818 RepID=A0A444WQG8_ARAHY|nr:hypothetical protein Ahy_Scaffold2g107620 [Arachis hypogaea]